MTMKERIKEEIDRLDEEQLEELYEVVKGLAESKEGGPELSLMARLKRIEIDAPEDFAANLDLYLSGEKRVE